MIQFVFQLWKVIMMCFVFPLYSESLKTLESFHWLWRWTLLVAFRPPKSRTLEIVFEMPWWWSFWFDSYAPHPPWSPKRGRLTEMDLLFLTSRLHCYYTRCQDQSLQLGLILRWLPTYSSKFPMKNLWTVGFIPLTTASIHRGFRQSPNTSPPSDPSAAAHWNSLKVRGTWEK